MAGQSGVNSRHSHSRSIGSITPLSTMAAATSDYEMVRNPDFAFPQIPPAGPRTTQPALPSTTPARPASMQSNVPRPRTAGDTNKHRRIASTLPSFSFNSADASGRQSEEDSSPPSTPPETATMNITIPVTPSRHTRNNSEFVGGDSRFGMSKVVSNSPTKSAIMSKPPSRGGHRRGQSVALSHHDLSSIMAAPESPRLSSSLPNSPLEQPFGLPDFDSNVHSHTADPVSIPAVGSDRPPSRREVAFSPNVEIIPRPLSTISSETESSISTMRGHSVNNSISSVLSMGMTSPASARVRSPSLKVMLEDEPSTGPRSSLEISKRIGKEGEWLKGGASLPDLRRPPSEPGVPSPRNDTATGVSMKSRPIHKKKQSLSHALGFDRRKSEPSMGMHTAGSSRFSALSLQDSTLHSFATQGDQVDANDSRSSTRRLKDWAFSKLARKQKEQPKSHPEILLQLPRTELTPPETEPAPVVERPLAVAETDLDAVFGGENSLPNHLGLQEVRPRSMIELNMPMYSQYSTNRSISVDGPDSMLDLDAALGPFTTLHLSSQRHRRDLHSSRLVRDFSGPGGHYLPSPSHRRAESAPMLTPFDTSRMSTPPQATMADVFEEDEEDDDGDGGKSKPSSRAPKPSGSEAAFDEESGIGIQVVDADASIPNEPTRAGRWCGEGDWVMERPTTSYGNQHSTLSSPVIERRPSSILDQTILEEPAQIETLEIVGDDEEPRAPSFTKSSDSSDTPTLLAPQVELRAVSEGARSISTLESLHNSAFSSPDFGRRQGSFDTSRVGTSASSATDNRTLNSYIGADLGLEPRVSVDDVPSLTSSRSTMMTHGNISRRDFHEMRTSSAHSTTIDRTISAEQRRKRMSIQSLSNFVGGSFGSKTNLSESRPQTASDALMGQIQPKKKDHRLKKLMFWKSKSREANQQA